MTADERRALAFLALLVFASAALRLAGVPEAAPVPAGGLDLASHIEATRAAVAERERLDRPLGEGERIDPNTATAAELQRLKGVGAALAGRIVADRKEHGRFATLESFGRVPGIGDATLARLAPHLDLRPGPTPVGASSRARRRAPAPERGAAGEGPGGASGGASGEALDLNAADAAALAGLSGIGPVLAARVVAYRDSAGPFGAVEELLAVKGIGRATLERIRARVRVYP